MGNRPLCKEEIQDIKERLNKALELEALMKGYIANLQSQLARGTAWVYDPIPEEEEAMAKDCKAFRDWLEKGGEMPEHHKYKWSWLKE